MNTNKLILSMLFFLVVIIPNRINGQTEKNNFKNTITIAKGRYIYPFDDNVSLIRNFPTSEMSYLIYKRSFLKSHIVTMHSIAHYRITALGYYYYFTGNYYLQNNSISVEIPVINKLYMYAGINTELRFGKESGAMDGAISNLDIGFGPEFSLRYNIYKRFSISADYNIVKHYFKTNTQYHEGNTHLIHPAWKIGLGYSF